MITFIKFVLGVKDSKFPHSLREQREVTIVAISTKSAYETYHMKTKHFQVEVNSIISADLIGEQACRFLLKDEAVLFSEDALRVLAKQQETI